MQLGSRESDILVPQSQVSCILRNVSCRQAQARRSALSPYLASPNTPPGGTTADTPGTGCLT